MSTIANTIALIRAIIDPLPVSNSAEKYNPRITEIRPKTWVRIMQLLKLRPTSWAVAAGVTSNAVTRSVPTTCTIETTMAATAALNQSPIHRVGIPWMRAAIASMVVASKAS